MKSIWNWLATPSAAKWVSFIAGSYFTLARLGETGSYWQAFNTALLFFAIWQLGRMTVKEQA